MRTMSCGHHQGKYSWFVSPSNLTVIEKYCRFTRAVRATTCEKPSMCTSKVLATWIQRGWSTFTHLGGHLVPCSLDLGLMRPGSQTSSVIPTGREHHRTYLGDELILLLRSVTYSSYYIQKDLSHEIYTA